MDSYRKGIAPFFVLFSFTLIIGSGLLYTVFPPLILVFINLIFLSLLFNNQKVTLYSGLGLCIVYASLWFTPWINTDIADKRLIYAGSLLLLLICTGFSLFILDVNLRTTQSLKHFFLLYENATEGIMIADERGKIIMANPTVCRFFGYSEKEIVNQPVEKLIPQKARDNHPQKRMNYTKAPTNREMGKGRDLAGLRKDGSEFPVEISLSSYKDRRKTFVIAFIIDITVRKNNEKLIIQSNETLEKLSRELSVLNNELERKVEERTLNLRSVMENLEESQRELKEALNKEKELNEIKSRFVSMASHEFRTPLSTVLSSAALLEKYTASDDQPKRDKHIRKIKESVRHLNDILEDFLSLGKLDEKKISLSVSEVNIRDIINQVIEEVSVFKEEGQQLSLDYEGPESGITDKNLFKNILINLLTNAIKFSPADGLINIECKNNESNLSIMITDRGIGIPGEDIDHLFASFFRSANAVNIQGTGLGLHIVKRYLDLLQGDIKIESELNRGTIVSLLIPQLNKTTT